jgi:UMF1 family MFS transporter
MSSTVAPTRKRGQVLSWALWDWGTSAFSVLITTFVFARYIISDAFIDPKIVDAYTASGETGAAKVAYDDALNGLANGLSMSVWIGGIIIVFVAPILGQRADAMGRRRMWLGINTGIVILATIGMFFIEPSQAFWIYGIVLYAIANIFYEFANVNYNAMLLQVSTPKNVGSVSGFGWGMGYIGGIVVLLISLFGFALGDNHWFGIPSDASLNIRVIFLIAAAWSLIFSIPVLTVVPEISALPGAKRLSLAGSYKKLVHDIRALFRNDRQTFYFLLASAIFRDGLVAVFALGAILAGTVFGFTFTEILFFGIAANLVAGIGVFLGGVIDNRIGPKPVIVGSLIGLIIAGLFVFFLHDGGPIIFWIGGLVLSLFVGPTQSASRSLLARVSNNRNEGELFGLYATTGRLVVWLSPLLFWILTTTLGAQYWGILAIVFVLLVGLIIIIPIKPTFTADAERVSEK